MIDIEQPWDGLKISYIGKDGKVAYKKYKVPKKWRWEYTNNYDSMRDRKFRSWDNRAVKKLTHKYFDNFSIYEYLNKQEDSFELFEYNKPKMHFCDIEVIPRDDKFPDPEVTKWPVNTIAIVNEFGSCTILGDKQLTKKQIDNIEIKTNKHFEKLGSIKTFDFKVKYTYFSSEKEMLHAFFKIIMPNITLLTGWNFIRFDWKYLVNRAHKIGLNVSELMGTKLLGDDQLPQHQLIVDYLEIYKKWDTTVKIKENNTLDYVSSQVLGLSKIKFNGSFLDLYEQDYEKLTYYCNVDTALLYFMDLKMNTMTTFLKMGLISKVPHQRAFSAVAITSSFYFQELYKHDKILLKDYTISPNREPFPGAYVKSPLAGLHDDIGAFDFASLYPTIMRQFMVSPEYYLGQIEDINVDLLDFEYIVCSNGSVFKKSKNSAIPIILTNLYADRKIAKKKMFIMEKEIDRLERLMDKI